MSNKVELITDLEWRREPRYKIARLPYRDAIELFNRRIGQPFSCRIVCDVDPIPEDAEVVDIHTAYETRSLDIVLWHPSFDLVTCGAETPRVGGQCRLTVYCVSDWTPYPLELSDEQ